jgi:hypothetical protein
MIANHGAAGVAVGDDRGLEVFLEEDRALVEQVVERLQELGTPVGDLQSEDRLAAHLEAVQVCSMRSKKSI